MNLHATQARVPRSARHLTVVRTDGMSQAPWLLPADAQPRPRPASRLLDLLVAAIALVVLSPVMVVVAVLVRCTSPGPALFRQERLGRGGRPFVMLKYRTMYVQADDQLHREYVRLLLCDPAAAACGQDGLYKLADDPRITPVGRWLRRTSLDELPQLLNVLVGDMAMVGPRPVLAWEARMFEPRHLARFRVRPGLTGLWQTSGRSRLTMAEALDLDVQYVGRQSMWLDVRLLLRTVPVVLRGEGVR